MKRVDMVRNGTKQLITAENAVENALCEVAALASTLGRMRLESDMSMVYGQDAMSALVESISLLSNARGAMIKAHGALNDVKSQMGCRTVMEGDAPNKPASTSEASPGLTVVASAKREAA
jgi:hypothetical protein